MPVAVDLERSPFLREMFEQVCERVRKKCSIENIMIVLQARFGDNVPEDVMDKLQNLSHEELKDVIGR
jgi:hypothetical protein